MMITIMFYIIWIINFLLVLFKEKSKLVTVITIGVMICIYFLSTGSGDYQNYLYAYNNSSHVSVESGFSWLMSSAKGMSLSFNQFQGIICTVSLFIILYVFKQYSDNYHLFFSLYFIYQFFYDIDTLKNFFARAILLLAFHLLINEKKIIYVFAVLLAFFIHRTAFVYLPLFLLDIRKGLSKSMLKYGAVTVFVLCVLAFFTGSRFGEVGSLLVYLLGGGTLEVKLDTYIKATNFGFLIYFLLHIIDIFLVYYGKKQVSTIPTILVTNTKGHSMLFTVDDKNTSKLYVFCWYINIYAVLFFPLIMINFIFFRLYNFVLILNFILFAKIADSYKQNTDAYYKYVFLCICLMLLYRLPFIHASAEFTRILGAL